MFVNGSWKPFFRAEEGRMIKHIVFWRLQETALGNSREENARIMQAKLEKLTGVIAGLRSIEVGLDFGRTDQSCDVVLYAEFDSRQALEAYQVHPAHQECVAFIRQVRTDRWVVDYEA